MSRSAKILAPNELRLLLSVTRRARTPLRDATIVLLSYKAGLRACEIAGLDWSMVLTPTGVVAPSISIAGTIAKNGRARQIPTNPGLRDALGDLRIEMESPTQGPVIRSQRGGHLTAKSVVNWFAALYAETGLTGCSSHSGRRTFITNSARLVAKVGGCLRDVQELAGHRALTTTERYIEGNREAQRKLMRLV